MMLTEWARSWGVPDAALADLRVRLGALVEHTPNETPKPLSEAAVQAATRVRASKLGISLFRNNVGAVHDAERGVHIRFGLANDSPQINRVCKSGDLIGIRPRIIQPSDIGHVIGQFVSIECKHGGWEWGGTEREIAQQNWASFIVSRGGEARFVSSADQL